MDNVPALLLDLETEIIAPTANLQPSAIGKGPCVAIIIQNRLSNIDNPITGNGLTLMIGKRSGQFYERLPGTDTPMIYTSDLENIFVRVQAAAGGFSSLSYCVIVYRKRNAQR